MCIEDVAAQTMDRGKREKITSKPLTEKNKADNSLLYHIMQVK